MEENYIIIKRDPVHVSKKEYIEHWENRLKDMKAGLISYKIEFTKKKKKMIKRFAEIEKELLELKK
jgi:hypothetical protein